MTSDAKTAANMTMEEDAGQETGGQENASQENADRKAADRKTAGQVPDDIGLAGVERNCDLLSGIVAPGSERRACP